MVLNLSSSTIERDEAELLTLTFSLSKSEEVIQVRVEASDVRYSWTLSATAGRDGRYTVGPLSMGRGVALPEGQYTLVVMLDNGQMISERFSVRRL